MKINLIFFIFFLIIGCSSTKVSEVKSPELERLINQNDTIGLKIYHKKVDSTFSMNSKLIEAKNRIEIGHYIFGYELIWENDTAKSKMKRIYTFDIDGKFLNFDEE